MSKIVRVGLIGTGFMGKSHAAAFRTMGVIFAPAVEVVLEMLADITGEAAARAAQSYGFRRSTGDWRTLAGDAGVDVVDITTPNHLHKEMALAAIAAGKHVYCEKPLASTAADARAMAEAAEATGVKTLVGFNFLKNPATGLAKQIVAADEIGTITHFRGTFDQDAVADPQVPFSWRFERAKAGAGALGDLGAHIINLAQYLVGDFAEVCGQVQTVIARRPLATGPNAGALRDVENEDQAQFLIRFAGGAAGSIETSRVARGRKIWLTYEITGTKGAIFFNQERMNELQLFRSDDARHERGFRTIYAGVEHPHYGNFFPVDGLGLGYNDQKVIEVYELVQAIANDTAPHPDFRTACKTNEIIDAVLRSAAEGGWVRVAGG